MAFPMAPVDGALVLEAVQIIRMISNLPLRRADSRGSETDGLRDAVFRRPESRTGLRRRTCGESIFASGVSADEFVARTPRSAPSMLPECRHRLGLFFLSSSETAPRDRRRAAAEADTHRAMHTPFPTRAGRCDQSFPPAQTPPSRRAETAPGHRRNQAGLGVGEAASKEEAGARCAIPRLSDPSRLQMQLHQKFSARPNAAGLA